MHHHTWPSLHLPRQHTRPSHRGAHTPYALWYTHSRYTPFIRQHSCTLCIWHPTPGTHTPFVPWHTRSVCSMALMYCACPVALMYCACPGMPACPAPALALPDGSYATGRRRMASLWDVVAFYRHRFSQLFPLYWCHSGLD